MADQHRSGIICQTIVNQLIASGVAGDEVYRDRIQWANELSASAEQIVVVRQGDEEITALLGDYIDVDLTVEVEIISRGAPTGQQSPATPIGEAVGTLRRKLTRCLAGDPALLGSAVNLGLAYVQDIYEAAAGPIEINETGQRAYGAQVITWMVKYRRTRIDPAS